MPNLAYNSPEEFIDAFDKLCQLNPDYDPAEVMEMMLKNKATIK
jgi:hypothetical protein